MAGGLNNLDASANEHKPNQKSKFRIFVATVQPSSESIITIPKRTVKFQITSLNSNSKLTVSHEANGTSDSSKRQEFSLGTCWVEDDLAGEEALTIYVKSSKVNTPVQVLYWINST
jgi:hypothetical protein